ncbi:MAG: hypothetical protein ACQGVK_00620 [Myxococcota bacterium]
MRSRARLLVVGAPLLLLGAFTGARARAGGSETALHGKTRESLDEVARQINNPISTLWQLTLDNQIVGQDGGGLDGVEAAYTGSFEPTMPVNLSRFGLGRFEWTRDFNVITRLTVPFFETAPLPSDSGGSTRESGFGDIQLGGVLAPNAPYGFIWGLGPTFIFPSASDDDLGQGKWQAGPAAVAGYQGKQWTAYALAQQWWSFAGDGHRSSTSQLDLNYVLLRTLPDRWQIGMQPSLTVDWKASGDDKVSLPVGLGVGKTLRVGGFPLQVWVEADYYPVRPDDVTGPRWAIDIQITPVIPELY